MASSLSARLQDSLELAKDRRYRSYFWASPPPHPPELVVVADDFSGAAAAPAAEGLWVVRIHPPHGAALSLVVDGGTGPLDAHRRDLNSTLLLLLFDPTVPMPMPSRPSLGISEGPRNGWVLRRDNRYLPPPLTYPLPPRFRGRCCCSRRRRYICRCPTYIGGPPG